MAVYKKRNDKLFVFDYQYSGHFRTVYGQSHLVELWDDPNGKQSSGRSRRDGEGRGGAGWSTVPAGRCSSWDQRSCHRKFQFPFSSLYRKSERTALNGSHGEGMGLPHQSETDSVLCPHRSPAGTIMRRRERQNTSGKWLDPPVLRSLCNKYPSDNDTD